MRPTEVPAPTTMSGLAVVALFVSLLVLGGTAGKGAGNRSLRSDGRVR